MKKITLLILILVLSATLISCKDSDDFISKNTIMMDTIVSIKIYDDNVKEDIFVGIIAYIADLENKLSFSIEGSDIWNINKNAGKWIEVSDETIELINKSKEISQISSGYFDISSGPLIDLWHISPPEGYYPTEDEITEAKSHIDYTKIQTDGNKVKIEDGMNINFGAIAKGYISDKAKEYMVEENIKYGIINLGGNVLVINKKPSGKKFAIGIAKPFSNRGELVGNIEIDDLALVSSGVYERYFVYKEEQYHHLLNPFTGYPEKNGIEAVSIICSEATNADAYSTAIFLLGLEDGLEVVESNENIEAIFLTDDKKIVVTSGIEGKLVVNEKSGYTLLSRP